MGFVFGLGADGVLVWRMAYDVESAFDKKERHSLLLPATWILENLL
jgi:hypothetical protein